jgi:hypothetical protein
MLQFNAIEPLESRWMLAAGDEFSHVTATVVDGTLFVRGDRKANGITIDAEGLEAGQVRITGNDTTQVNGEFFVILDGVTRDLRVQLRGGGDSLTVENIDVKRDLEITGGEQADDVFIENARVGRGLRVVLGGGDDSLDVLDGSVGRKTDIKAGAGNDILTFDGTKFDDAVRLDAGRGDDTVYLAPTVAFKGRKRIEGGPGDDIITRQAVSDSTDFRSGLNGWAGNFADYSDEHADMRLDWGLRPLPDELEQDGTGFFIQGMNRSDDLLMYLTRQISGLKPDTTYQVRFDITFASNAGTGCGGIGGAPGESVYLKAGATPDTPTRSKDAEGLWRASFDHGQQSQGGADASVVDTIENGNPDACGDDAEYATLRKKHVHTHLVTTDAQGRLHLIVGTDSGFEGLTALYYQQIMAHLVEVAGG